MRGPLIRRSSGHVNYRHLRIELPGPFGNVPARQLALQVNVGQERSILRGRALQQCYCLFTRCNDLIFKSALGKRGVDKCFGSENRLRPLGLIVLRCAQSTSTAPMRQLLSIKVHIVLDAKPASGNVN